MAQSPRFKIINPQGEYIASCKHAEDAAMIVAAYGDGAKVRDKNVNRVVWQEGKEAFNAAASYDGAALKMWERINAAHEAASARYVELYGVKL